MKNKSWLDNLQENMGHKHIGALFCHWSNGYSGEETRKIIAEVVSDTSRATVRRIKAHIKREFPDPATVEHIFQVIEGAIK
jgi:hypothetical protein